MTTPLDTHNATLTAAREHSGPANATAPGTKSGMGPALKPAPAKATGTLHTFSPSIISCLFARLNSALAEAIEAERDIDHINTRDPAVDAWVREAERAWRTVVEIQVALRDAPVLHASDAPLLALLDRAVALMTSDTPYDFGVAYDRLRLCAFLRRATAPGQVPDHINRLLDQCQAHLLAVARLDLYQPVCDPEDSPYGSSEAWPEVC